jgi:hypothetical protein
MLFDYMKTVEGFIRDRNQRLINPQDIVRYVNRARREIAMRTQCIRKIPPISGPITTIQVTTSGSGYTNPVVTITAPDLPGGQRLNPGGRQATATAMLIAGQIAGISVTDGGDGYFQPAVTITDSHGTGATATAQTVPLNVFVANQEEYFLRDIPVYSFPGVKSVFATLSHYVIFSNIRYRISQYALTDYKSWIENYPFQYYFVPVACAQKEQGAGGSFLFYPIPSQKYAWEPDCLCLPDDLIDDQSPEAIPEPFNESVPYLAASFCYDELQNYNSARYWEDRYNRFTTRYAIYSRPRLLVSTYGRG